MDEKWITEVKEWAIKAHADTNHMYGKIYPYALHLNWVASVGRKYLHLVPDHGYLRTNMVATCYTHDIIEDARLTYNDVKKVCGEPIAEATFVLTNMRGRNRQERANDEYYEGIRSNKIARYVKLMDRAANVEFGLKFGGSMVGKYTQEMPEFLDKTGAYDFYPEVAAYLKSLVS